MEVVKVKDVVTEYRSYEWSGYTPLGMIIKKQNESGTFETVRKASQYTTSCCRLAQLASSKQQFITNHRGDVLSIRDSEDQEVGAYTYDAYGNILTVEGDLAKANSIRYAGYYYDDETKNYYLQARYYNPANGSFLSLDPHPGDDDEPLSQNGYTYGNNNPVMNVDSNGLKPNRIFYALMTSIAYVVAAVVGDLKDVAFIAQTLWSMIKDYFDVKKAKSQRTTEAARKVVRNSRALSKVIEKRAKKAARIAGVAVLRKSFGGWYLLGRFSIGIYQGGRNKYFQYAPCYRSAYTYGSYVAKKRLG